MSDKILLPMNPLYVFVVLFPIHRHSCGGYKIEIIINQFYLALLEWVMPDMMHRHPW